jgi:hypothetical protein
MLFHKLLGATAAGPAGIQFVGGRAAVSSTSTATPTFDLTGLSGGIASAPSAGDIVIACISLKSGTDRDIQCTTSGFIELADLYANGTNDSQLGVFYKVLSTAETTVSFSFVLSTTSYFAVHVWRGQNATPLDATRTTTTNTTSGRPNAPAITTVTPGAVVIAVGAAAGASATPLSNLTAPTDMVNFFQSTEADTASVGIASALRPTAGAFDPPTFGGGSTNTANSSCAVTLALRPE